MHERQKCPRITLLKRMSLVVALTSMLIGVSLTAQTPGSQSTLNPARDLPPKSSPLICVECIPPLPPPGQPDDIYLENSLLKIGISTRFGGSIDFLEFKPRSTDGNLVSSGDSGLLLQTAFKHVKASWTDPSNDDTGLPDTSEFWEDTINKTSPNQPSCSSSQHFVWNPTEGGTYSSCDPDGGRNYFTNPGEVLPYHEVSGDDTSPVHFTIKFRPWVPYDILYENYPSLEYRANIYEDATVSFVLAHFSDVAVFKHTAEYKLYKKDQNGNDEFGISVAALCEDQVFFASGAIQREFVYNPDTTNDCYGMKNITNIIPEVGSYQGWGWRTHMGEAKWTPYVLVSTAPDGNGNRTWMLIYNTQDSPGYIQARRRLVNKSDGVTPGPVVTFVTAFYPGALSTDYYSSPLTTYYIFGSSYGHVMQELWYVSGGMYPRQYGADCSGCSTYRCSP